MIGRIILIIVLLTFEGIGLASDFRVLDLDRAAFSASEFECNRDPYTPDIDCEDYLYRAAFDIDIRILEVGYWDNRIHTEAVSQSVKTVGWEWELGLRVAPGLELFRHHHSRHVMEETTMWGYHPGRDEIYPTRYPVEDSWGVRFTFHINERPRRSLFGN